MDKFILVSILLLAFLPPIYGILDGCENPILPSSPQISVLPDYSNLIVKEYETYINVSPPIVKGDMEIKLKYTGKTQKDFEFDIEFDIPMIEYIYFIEDNIRQNRLNKSFESKYFNKSYIREELNKYKFNISLNDESIVDGFNYTFSPNEEIIIKINYVFPIIYNFTKPDYCYNDWFRGYFFKVKDYPLKQGGLSESICTVKATFPSDFNVFLDPTEPQYDWVEDPIIEKFENKTFYSLKTKSKCVGFTVSKAFSTSIEKETPIETFILSIGIVIGMLILGYRIFYKSPKIKHL